MRLTVRKKIVIIGLLLLLFGFVLLETFGQAVIRKQCENKEVNEMYEAANYLGSRYSAKKGSLPQGELEMVAFTKNVEIEIIDNDGNVRKEVGMTTHAKHVPDFNPADGKNAAYMIGNFYETYDEEMISVYAPLIVNVEADGYVVLHCSMKKIQSLADEEMSSARAAFLLMAILIVCGIVLLDFVIVRPLKEARHAGKEYAGGNMTYEHHVKSKDEIGDIAHTASDLAHQLNTAAEDQKQFLANISHDFRSPLTSIQGYLGAIQDGTIEKENQDKYIDIVLNETTRLNKLANGLLDITQYEKGVILNKTEFDLHELIRKTVATFEGTATERGIVFDLIFETENQDVYADKGRIEQVIYNLADNALKFSKKNSTIDISTHLRGEKVFVSVKDRGIGIPKKDLGKIWNRFYKSDLSRGKDKKGTGLGLSIVREIIQAHKENIDVISTEGVGTEFVFSLPESADA